MYEEGFVSTEKIVVLKHVGGKKIPCSIVIQTKRIICDCFNQFCTLFLRNGLVLCGFLGFVLIDYDIFFIY